ncbi:FecR family protein [Chitinophaga jiangningensis]|uniref:FecR family protein n=1 Tax=Chitinophaga jiangningensis TaxID=1419482 RepID=A0A1M7MUQ3_9BACT|nr:FecR domain-containing protein [Chitinophaga jiangningensis]SHM94757.1 FecR family protein [Chitinophaga jiangningensis]
MMNNQQLKNIAARYLKGEATPEELQQLEAWFAAAEQTPANLSAQDLQDIKADMLGHIRQEAGYCPPELEEKSLGFWRTIRRIAAIVIIAVSAGTLAWLLRPTNTGTTRKSEEVAVVYRTYITVSNDKGVTRRRLPDSSIVVMNSGASFKYEHNFNNHTRELILENGEIFIDVKKQTEKPFKVVAGNTVTTVLGTSFNLKMDNDKNTVSIVVKSGKVKVAADSTRSDAVTLLTPDEGLFINTLTNAQQYFRQPASVSTAWCAQELVFRQTTMENVAATLENRYNIQIRLMTTKAQQYKVSGDFNSHHDAESILQAICLVHQLNYKKSKNTYFVY